MSHDYDSRDSGFTTAIAAATFAIHSTEEGPLARVKTRKEELFQMKEAGGLSRGISVKESKGAASMKRHPGQDGRASFFTRPAPLVPGASSTRDRRVESKADAWERAEMAKIQRRCEKINSSILSWENEKKTMAKTHMEKKKSELELRRAKNWRHYEQKLERIYHIAGGAREQVEEQRKSEESKVKERANKIRSSGKAPECCSCF